MEIEYILPDFGFVQLCSNGRSLQMKRTQLTTTNIAKAFKLMPESIILVSEKGALALPQEGVFEDIDNNLKWNVEGDPLGTLGMGISTTSTGSSKIGVSSNFGLSSSSMMKTCMKGSSWKPHSFTPLAKHLKLHPVLKMFLLQSKSPEWIKNIELLTLKGRELMVVSEYSIALDETTSNVVFIQEHLSSDAFNGDKVILLNAKNIPIADTEVSRGSKYWRTARTIRAVAENLYERFRAGTNATAAGPSSGQPVISIRTTSPVQISDSDSETYVHVAKKRKCNVPTPPASPLSIADSSDGLQYKKISDKIDELKQHINVHFISLKSHGITQNIKEIFTCLICKTTVTESSCPLVPPCCKAVLVCTHCLQQWVANTPVCPHCRAPIQEQDCLSFPFIRPLLGLLEESD